VRAHGDLTVIDPITGNPFVESAHQSRIINSVKPDSADGSFPGYMAQWDQMLYRDVDVTGATTVKVRFRYQTRMSTALSTSATGRTGWFFGDPLKIPTAADGNYIEAGFGSGNFNPDAPRDSFTLYVGSPVEPVAGLDNDFTASDGLQYDIFDPQRRWFSEIIDIFSGAPYYALFGVAGDNAGQVEVEFDASTLATTTARLVFRNQTDREQSSSDATGSVSGRYNSGGAGAVILDEVEVDVTGTGASYVTIGTFNSTDNDIDNDTAVSALTKWKSTGKPPYVYPHLINENDGYAYDDLCGGFGTAGRLCNLGGNFVSFGNADDNERLNGGVGTPDYDRYEGILSPTVNLVVPANPLLANNMGLKADDIDATEDAYGWWEIYTGAFTYADDGNLWSPMARTYPVAQNDGAVTWATNDLPGGSFYYNPDPQCLNDFWPLQAFSMYQTSNASGIPDSIRIGVVRVALCYQSGLSADCGTPNGIYYDNFSLAFIDGGGVIPVSDGPWDRLQDTFPFTENPALVGNPAAFDTCAALIRNGLNLSVLTNTLTDTWMVPGDTTVMDVSASNNQRVDFIFRILPGPGNYVTAGDRSSGLRVVPTSLTAIASADGSFWSAYIDNNGPYGSAGGHPAGSPYEARWSELVWNSARCDTGDVLIFPVLRASSPVGGTALPPVGTFAAMLHEDDPNFGTLGILKNRCFLDDTAGAVTDVNCGRVVEGYGVWPPDWVTSLPGSQTGWDGTTQTKEGTKIIPDGLLTPGSHVQYFWRRQDDQAGGAVYLMPDTTTVFPQAAEGSFDAQRWQNVSVLPDAWKNPLYGGLGEACLLYVDWADQRGQERVFVSVMDSIGGTNSSKYGSHNGWRAPGTGNDAVNDPASFVYDKVGQAGTTWDMYQVRAGESSNNPTGTLGSRLSYRGIGTERLTGKWAQNAPTPLMLETYYKIVAITTGDLNLNILGQFLDRSSDDREILRLFMLGSSAGLNRGVLIEGDGFVEDEEGAQTLVTNPVLGLLSTSLRNPSYQALSGNLSACADLITQAAINSNGDIYGIDNSCLYTLDVLNVETGGTPAALYQTAGVSPVPVASVLHAASAPDYWISMVDGWQSDELHGRYCQTSYGRLAYFYNVFNTVFGSICDVAGSGPITLDTPQTGNGKVFTDFMTLGNNPVYRGSALINFGLASSKKVTLKIYDVSGRLVRTLVDGQLFKAGEHQLVWDGVSNQGRTMPRGVYFSSWETDGGATVNRKITLLK
jgi:hypothetical protein